MEEKKPVIETATVIVAPLPTTIIETPTAPGEITTQNRGLSVDLQVKEPVVEKVLTKIAVPKLAAFKGAGPFRFALGLTNQESSSIIRDPELAMGLKVFSQTPTVCRVSAVFNQATGKYSISVTGLSNGQCKITALDKGSDEKFPTATEIKQTITGIPTRKTVTARATKPTPAPKVGIKKASYKP